MTSNTASAFPEDVARILDGLRAADADARVLVSDLDERAFNWQPNDGRSWSIAQCLDHLTRTGWAYLKPLEAAIEKASGRGRVRRAPIDPGYFGGLFAKYVEPPPRFRFPAPRKIQPASRGARHATLAAFLEMQAQTRALLERAAGLDLNGARFANPFVPGIRFRAGAGFLILDGHNRRHLWQARRVRQASGFPGMP
jgi:hypothetical protein